VAVARARSRIAGSDKRCNGLQSIAEIAKPRPSAARSAKFDEGVLVSALVAGVDCSTQATKVLILDVADGTVVARGQAPHQVTGRSGTRESNAEDWWTALRKALDQTGRGAELRAIAVAGQQHALVVLDELGRPLHAVPLWNDTTSAADAEALIAELGAATWARRVGSVPTSAFTVAKWASLRRSKPASLSRIAAVRLPHDFITERICGRAVTDRGDASGTGWWSPDDAVYATDVLKIGLLGLDVDLLPEVLMAEEPAGAAGGGSGASALGLSPQTIVAAGTGDNMAAAVGLGLTPGTPVLSLGTSGTVFVVTERPACDATGTVAGFADAGRHFLPLACTLNATLAVDRVAAWLGIDREDVAPAAGVAMLPYLDGERTPDYPGASGSIVGLRHDTRPQQILQAAYDGVVAGLLAALDEIGANTGGVDAEAPLILIGGGARGAAWRATASRLSGRRLQLPCETEVVALGAAALAAASLDGGDATAIAHRWACQRPPQAIEAVKRDEARLRYLGDVRERLEGLNATELRT
jgi:xylulokinase